MTPDYMASSAYPLVLTLESKMWRMPGALADALAFNGSLKLHPETYGELIEQYRIANKNYLANTQDPPTITLGGKSFPIVAARGIQKGYAILSGDFVYNLKE